MIYQYVLVPFWTCINFIILGIWNHIMIPFWTCMKSIMVGIWNHIIIPFWTCIKSIMVGIYNCAVVIGNSIRITLVNVINNIRTCFRNTFRI